MFTFAEKLKQMSNIEHKDVGVSSLKGTPSKKIYIKTSTEAVYNPEGVTQEYINNHVDGSKIVDGTITTSKIANNAVAMGKLGNEVQTLIQQGADSSWTPMGDFNIETTYDANDVVFDSVTNSSYLSLRADNTGHPVDENDEEYEEGWWMKVLDGSYVNRAIEEMEAAIAQAIEDAQEDISELISDSQATIDTAVSGANSAAQSANTAAQAATTAKNTLVTEISQSLAVYETVADTIVTDPEAATGLLPVQNYVLGQAIDRVASDKMLYMLRYILSNALYVSDQAYNIEEFFKTYKDGGSYVKVPIITQDPSTLAVTITAEAGVTIYYSDDGSIPIKRYGIAYSEPFVPAEDCIVKAIAYGTGNLKSLMVSFTAKGSGIVVFKDANLEAVAKAATTADVVVTLPDSTTTTVKGLGWDKDHDGVITLDDMRQVTSLPAVPGTTFNRNQWIQYLDVLRYARFTSCNRYSFNQCPNLKELTIPKTCTTTQAESILQCTSLQRLVFEEGVTSVGQIKNCTIAKMKLPDSLTSFGGITGCGTSLSASGGLVIPKNVTAFPNVYNTKVGRIKHLGNITTIPMNNLSYAGNVKVYLASNVVPTKTGTASQGTITELYVPDEMIPLYAESADWATMYSKGDIISIKYWVD